MKELRIYRPNRENKGVASKIQIVNKPNKGKEFDEIMVFWTGTHQTGVQDKNATFGWEDKEKTVTMKLGMVDIGELLAVLNGNKLFVGMKPEQGLYHQNASGNCTMQFKPDIKDNNLCGFLVRVSGKKNDKIVQVQHNITLSEAEQLRIILTRAVEMYYLE